VGGVAFLPEELARAEEGLRVFEFPADDRVPLVEFEGQIAVGFYPFCVVWVVYMLAQRKRKEREEDVQGYMTVSEVGRIAMGSSSSDWPLLEA
jgi:hypothetical protein